MTDSIDMRKIANDMIQEYISKPKYVVNIEKSIYNKTIEHADENNIIKRWDNPHFKLLYKNLLRTIIINLQENKELCEKIMSKKIKSYKVGYMTHQEMNPIRWEKLMEMKKKKEENMYAPKLEASTDNFTCRDCKSKKCSYYQLQTRSADEPMTTFVTCLNCGNRWKC